MTPRKLSVFFSFFPYSGNGGYSSEHPSVRKWFARTILKCKSDPRVGEIFDRDYSDTPITMTRNMAVQDARQVGADLLVMCDSDQWPDYELSRGDPLAKPFWDTSFDFVHRYWEKGPHVVASPYCGPPPNENVYVFVWRNRMSDNPNADMQLEQFTREEAAVLGGIHEVAALPTGLILWDMRAFDLVKPPYFYYEWTDEYQQAKGSTEDVTATRDISMNGLIALGYNPLFCNFDAWAGHLKPKVVSKPRLLRADEVSEKLAEAVARRKQGEQLVNWNVGDPLPQGTANGHPRSAATPARRKGRLARR